MKEFLKKLCVKTKALLLAILIIGAFTLVSMLLVSLAFTLADREYLFTLENFGRAFLNTGCGVGLAVVHRDMLDYLKD